MIAFALHTMMSFEFAAQCMHTGWDMGEVCSPAPQKRSQRQKGQQALTKYVRYDSSSTKPGKPPQHKETEQAETMDTPSLLNAKPVRAGQSITAALSRQTRKKPSTKEGAALSAEEAAKVLATDLKQACHTGKSGHAIE